jgi:hypothetical protein
METAGVMPSKVKGNAVKINVVPMRSFIMTLLHLMVPKLMRYATTGDLLEARGCASVIIVFVLRPHAALLRGVSRLAKHEDRKEGQPLLLIGLQGLV